MSRSPQGAGGDPQGSVVPPLKDKARNEAQGRQPREVERLLQVTWKSGAKVGTGSPQLLIVYAVLFLPCYTSPGSICFRDY